MFPAVWALSMQPNEPGLGISCDETHQLPVSPFICISHHTLIFDEEPQRIIVHELNLDFPVE